MADDSYHGGCNLVGVIAWVGGQAASRHGSNRSLTLLYVHSAESIQNTFRFAQSCLPFSLQWGMIMTRPQFSDLSENHRRAISTAALMLDEMLCKFEQYARGRELHSVAYHERNRLSHKQREKLLAEIEQIRTILRELKDALHLEADTQDVGRNIWATSSAFWAVLVETETKYLRRYGRTPSGLAEFLDPRIEAMIRHLRNVSRIAGAGPVHGRTHVETPPGIGNGQTEEADRGT